jgi:hypothetical protein
MATDPISHNTLALIARGSETNNGHVPDMPDGTINPSAPRMSIGTNGHRHKQHARRD